MIACIVVLSAAGQRYIKCFEGSVFFCKYAKIKNVLSLVTGAGLKAGE